MIRLGQKVRDIVTGFEGIATQRIQYLNGCIQYQVKPRVGKDGKQADPDWVDVDQLEVVGDGILDKKAPARNTGGPTPAGTPTAYRG